MQPHINIKDYNYNLPDGRIAKYPLTERDASKLLKYQDGEVSESRFNHLPDFLPENALMIVNDTKVVPARLHFQRQTGAHIEIFCLEPHSPAEYASNFAAIGVCRWKCIVGNVKRWKDDLLNLYNPQNDKELQDIDLKANLVERQGETSIIEFTWQGDYPFSRILELCGRVPIPPYLNRETESIDLERYQTVYAHFRGSVAAPTAGLHFTERVMEEIKAKNIDEETVCLHVGAGTFLPVKSDDISEHQMHREPFVVSSETLHKIRDAKAHGRKIIAVGTTSVRTLESLYYAGVMCIEKGKPQDIPQWIPYEKEYNYSIIESIDAIIAYLEANDLDSIKLGTQIIIVPGFVFRIVDILITNFHQPQSTLLLLISAFVKGDWHKIYDYAMSHEFRFLSYGDSSILFKA